MPAASSPRSVSRNQRLVLNGVVRDPGDDGAAIAFTERQAAAVAGAPEQLSAMPVAAVELIAGDVTGLRALRQLAGANGDQLADSTEIAVVDLPGLEALVDELDAAGNAVVMTMGKGGVGKTTLAAAIALALVDRGHEVTLSTTDPAAHITDALADAAADGLTVERIDPAVETARYTEEVLASAAGLDEEGRTLLEEDLRSPCTEEIAVFRAFARTVDAARERIVVLDTAPTGHTLLLLDAAQSYQREVQRTNANVPAEVSELLARLRDPEFARMLVVTLAESTPVQEAERLQEDLRRAGIEPFGWVINSSMTAARDDASDVARSRWRRAGAHRARPAGIRAADVVGRLAVRGAGRPGCAARAFRRSRAQRKIVSHCRLASQPGIPCRLSTSRRRVLVKHVLFVCNHNAGRSQMAQAFFERYAPDDVRAESAGSSPARQVWPEVVEAMREVGIDLSERKPKKLLLEMQLHADWAVTMGCDDACPYVPTIVEAWSIPDPAGLPLEEVHAIRDSIEAQGASAVDLGSGCCRGAGSLRAFRRHGAGYS